MSNVHSTALVDPAAKIHPDAEIGPFCIIGPKVSIGAGTRLHSNVKVSGYVEIGEKNEIFNGTALGEVAQDFSIVPGGDYRLKIGNNNIIRENVTMHLSTKEGKYTTVGNNNFFMVGSHVAHDVVVGNHAIIINEVALAGHTVVENNAYIGGISGIVQFVRIGAYAALGANSKISMDLPPYFLANGNPARVHGINMVGLKRAGFTIETRKYIKEVYRNLYLSHLPLKAAIEKSDALLQTLDKNSQEYEKISHLVDFIKNSKKGIAHHAGSRAEEKDL